MARGTAHADGTQVVPAPHDPEQMRMAVIALRRMVAVGVAVEAARMQQHRAHPPESLYSLLSPGGSRIGRLAGERRAPRHESGDDERPHLPGPVAAARWIALRTRAYVPQRHRFVIAASISASEGAGRSFRSAAAAMIIPDWQ